MGYYLSTMKTIPTPPLLVVVAWLMLWLAASGCRCDSDSTDEQLLVKKTDKLRVHLYVGAKDALARAENSSASRALVGLLKKAVASRKANKGGPGQEQPGEGGKLASLRSTLRAGKTLIKLRGTGKRLVRAGSESGRPPLFPWWFKEDTDEKQRLASEHAVMLATLFAFKAHEEVPVPVPTALVLYEAARTDPASLPSADYRPPLHLIRSFVMGTNGLCDLAQKEADLALAQKWNPARLNTLLRLIPRKKGKLRISDKVMQRVGVALEAGAHGANAICYMDRDQEHKATAALGKFVNLLQKAGVKSSRFDLVRAFSHCASGQRDQGKKLLDQLQKGPDGKQLADQITRLHDQCESQKDPGSTWEKLNLNVVIIQLFVVELQNSGIHQWFDQTELARWGRRMMKTFSKFYEQVKDKARIKGEVEAEAPPTRGSGGVQWLDLLD